MAIYQYDIVACQQFIAKCEDQESVLSYVRVTSINLKSAAKLPHGGRTGP